MVTPVVSVICPTFNRSAAILPTLHSVLAQSIREWELIVVSDGSTDDTDEHVRALAATDGRIRLLRTERHGHPSGPRNAGLAAARGTVVAYLDHDDRWRPDHLRVVLDAFDDGAELVATGYQRRDSSDMLLSSSQALTLCWHPEIQTLAPLFEPSRVAHLAGLAERVGGWRSGIGLEDWDLWLRLADRGHRFVTLEQQTVVVLEDSGTRMHRTPRRHRMVLASFDDPYEGRAALRRLRHPDHADENRRACQEDLLTWFDRLSGTGELVTPRGWEGDLAEEIAAACVDVPVWPDVELVPQRGRYALVRTLWCATETHALRVERLARDVQSEQLRLVQRIIGQ